MTATLWINTEREETIELGGTLPMYAAFADMARAAGPGYLRDWPDLFGVPTLVGEQRDAPPDWLADVRRQARRFLRRHGARLGGQARAVLEALTTAGAPRPRRRGGKPAGEAAPGNGALKGKPAGEKAGGAGPKARRRRP